MKTLSILFAFLVLVILILIIIITIHSTKYPAVKTGGKNDVEWVVVVLGGGTGNIGLGRIKQGIETFMEHKAKYLIIVGSEEEVKFMREVAVTENINVSAIISDNRSRNTVDNAYYCKKILKSIGLHNVLLVTSEFHMERALAIFEWVLGDEYRIVPIPVQDYPEEDILQRESVLRNLVPFLRLLKKGDEETIKRVTDIIFENSYRNS